MSRTSVIVSIFLLGLVAAVILMPQIRRLWLNLRADEVTIDLPAGNETAAASGILDLRIITVLGKDGIPAILQPQFIDGGEAAAQMRPSERVIGLSIDGDHRAYPLNLLSRHEIVNDTVGDVPVAVTW
jgi:hypothetical protein